jgi:hypothetical protein
MLAALTLKEESMRKLSGVIVFGLGLLAWCGSEARAQEGMGGLKGLPGQMKNDAGTAVQQEIGGATGKLGLNPQGQPVAAPADAGAQKAGAMKDAPAKAADDGGAGMKGGGDADQGADDTK